MKQSLSMRIAWMLPPKVLLWAVIRGHSLVDNGPASSYREVYNAIVKKYKINEHKI